MKPSPGNVAAGILALGMTFSGCAPKEDRAADAPGSGHAAQGGHVHHEKQLPTDAGGMPFSQKHAVLLKVAQELENGDDPYFGNLKWNKLQKADTTKMTPKEMASHCFHLAWEHFRLGRPEEAERLFARSRELHETPNSVYLLGVSQLRVGERQNCVAHHNSESCVMPLAGGGVHTEKSGAQRAIETLGPFMDTAPADLRPHTRWFLNVAAMAAGIWPSGLPAAAAIPPERFESDYDIKRFTDIAMPLGLAPLNLAGGSAMDDFDNDGLMDIIISNASVRGQLRHYKNRGDGSFEEVTEKSGVLGQWGGLNFIHCDYDGDGWLDVLVLRGGWMGTNGRIPRSLLHNRGDGTFEDMTERMGLTVNYPCQTAAFADYDLDGDLDLFLGNETPPPESGLKYPCQLYRNDDGRFVDVTDAAGVHNYRLTKGCAWGDWDGDRDPDLYLSNQFGKNRFYRNEGNGKFTDVAPAMGVDEPTYSFPTWFWDYDNDGALDLFVAGYRGDVGMYARSVMRPDPKWGDDALFHNENGKLVNHGREAGLTLQTFTMGANYGDLDNDGWLDFYLGTGSPQYDSLVPNVMWRNDGHGKFQDVTKSGGFGQLQKGHGVSWGDLDHDGDQDIFLETGGIYPYDGFYNSLFINPGHGNRWITLEVEGVTSNRQALGTSIHVRTLEGGKPRSIWRWVWPSGSFGGSGFRQEIGLGKAEKIVSVELYWPKTDRTQKLTGFELDSFYKIREDSKAPEKLSRRRFHFPGT